MIKGRFDLDTAFHLEREDDPDTISNKWFDFSITTITKLIEDGRYQALSKLCGNAEKEKDKSYAQQQLKLFINLVEKSRENGEIKPHHAGSLINVGMAVSMNF